MAFGNICYLTVLGVEVPNATPLVALLDDPAEPDSVDIEELGLMTAAELVVEDVVTSGLVVSKRVFVIDPPITSPGRLSLSALSTMIVMLAVALIVLSQTPMDTIGD